MKNDETSVSDLNLSAFLLASGHRIVRVAGPPGRREFVFQSATPAITNFYGGDDRISARALFDALRNVKGLAAQGFAVEGAAR